MLPKILQKTQEELALVVGVDTQVFHGIVNCGAIGVITGIGNVIPEAVLKLYELSLPKLQMAVLNQDNLL